MPKLFKSPHGKNAASFMQRELFLGSLVLLSSLDGNHALDGRIAAFVGVSLAVLTVAMRVVGGVSMTPESSAHSMTP